MKALPVALALGLVSTLANASPNAKYRFVDPRGVGAPWIQPQADTVSHVIYLNNCAGGCTLHAGYDDSLTNTSSIPNGTASISAYSGGAANWAALVACVQQTYSPFDVQIVTTRPTSGNYHMAIVAGTAAEVGESAGVLGVSPFTCGYIPNSISFTFANEEPTNIDDLCWTVSQETAHSWGLDHKFDDRDPMTYLQSGPAMKTFQNQAGSCGEYSARQCNCTYAGTGSSGENSYALIMATFGSNAPDTTPPTVQITAPANGSQVMGGFSIAANVTDDQVVAKAELRIDGNLIGEVDAAPYVWNAPSNLSQGSHHVEVKGYDLKGNTATDAIDVADGTVCTKNSDCTTAGDVCLGGHCVPGPGMPGGLGSTCTANSDCQSGECANDGSGHSYCTEPCDPAQHQCPNGFSCQTAGTGGVCWPGADNGGGGGCSTDSGSNGTPFLLLGLGFCAALITRRRR